MTYQIWHMKANHVIGSPRRYVVYANIHHIGTYPTLGAAEARANEHNASLGNEPLTPWGPLDGPVLSCKVTACESGQPGATKAAPNPRKRQPKNVQNDYRANPFKLEP